MNRRKFLGLAAAAPLVAPAVVKEFAAPAAPLWFDAPVLPAEYKPIVWASFPQDGSPWVIKTKSLTLAEIRLLYPDNLAALKIRPRRSHHYPPADSKSVSSERAPG